MFGCVAAPWWVDATVFIVGGGASLRGFDFDRLRSRGHVVGVNQSLLDLSFCAAGISADLRFVTERRDDLAEFARGRQLYLCLGSRPGLPLVPGAVFLAGIASADPVSLYPTCIRRGPTSGHVALNLAVLKRSRRIVLLGFDYGEMDGRRHYHDAYGWHQEAAAWAIWAKEFDAMARPIAALGIEVVNASPQSAITAFPRMTIDEALARPSLF